MVAIARQDYARTWLHLSTTKNNDVQQCQPAGGTIWNQLRDRPVFHKELGDFLREHRTARGWTMRQAAMLAKERGLVALTRQILFRLERGQIKTPEPEVLLAAAKLYHLPYDDLVNRWARAHFKVRRDLLFMDPSGSTGRADSTHGNNSEVVTSSVSPALINHRDRPEAGGPSHEEKPAATADHLSQSQSTRDAEVRARIVGERQAIARDLITKLYASADDIRAVADALQAGAPPPAPRATRPAHAGGRAQVRRAGTRRGRS